MKKQLLHPATLIAASASVKYPYRCVAPATVAAQ